MAFLLLIMQVCSIPYNKEGNSLNFTAAFHIGFEENTYDVMEGEVVNICIGFLTPQALQNAVFSDVIVDVISKTTQDQSSAGKT